MATLQNGAAIPAQPDANVVQSEITRAFAVIISHGEDTKDARGMARDATKAERSARLATFAGIANASLAQGWTPDAITRGVALAQAARNAEAAATKTLSEKTIANMAGIFRSCAHATARRLVPAAITMIEAAFAAEIEAKAGKTLRTGFKRAELAFTAILPDLVKGQVYKPEDLITLAEDRIASARIDAARVAKRFAKIIGELNGFVADFPHPELAQAITHLSMFTAEELVEARNIAQASDKAEARADQDASDAGAPLEGASDVLDTINAAVH
jgi:hypothetical protein